MEGFILLRDLTLQLLFWYAHIFAWFPFVCLLDKCCFNGKEEKKERKKPWGFHDKQYSRIQKVIVPFVMLHVCFSRLLSGSYEDTFPFMGL